MVKELDAGSHTIFVGEVMDTQVFKEGKPMTYAFYHHVKRGTISKTIPTYVETKERRKRGEGHEKVQVHGMRVYLRSREGGS